MAGRGSSARCSAGGESPASVILALSAALAFTTVSAAQIRRLEPPTLRVLTAGACPDVPGVSMTSCNTTLRMEGRTTVVFDVDLFLDREATTITKLTVNRTRCHDIVAHNTCLPDQQFVITSGVCGILSTPLMPWSAFVERLQPPFKCPLRRGFYSGHGIAIDMRVARPAMRPTDDVGILYVGSGTIYDQNKEPFMCMEVTTDVVRLTARPPRPPG